MTAAPPTGRTDRVTALFAPGQPAEGALDGQISALVKAFLQTRAVAEPADPAALADAFAGTEVPGEGVAPGRYVGWLAANVVPYSDRVASPLSLAHMSQGLPYFLRPLARLVAGLNQNLTKADASRALSLCERQALGMMHRLVYDRDGRFYERHARDRDATLGVVTSGGTVANVTALWAARNAALGPRGDFGGVEHEGLVTLFTLKVAIFRVHSVRARVSGSVGHAAGHNRRAVSRGAVRHVGARNGTSGRDGPASLVDQRSRPAWTRRGRPLAPDGTDV